MVVVMVSWVVDMLVDCHNTSSASRDAICFRYGLRGSPSITRRLVVLVTALTRTYPLTWLNFFQYNQLTEDACFHLNDLLLHNTIVAELNLRGCRIGPSGAKKLVDGLSTTTSLLSLDLSRCELKDEGLLEIVPAILACGTLSFIDLSHNLLASGSAEILKTLLSENESLRHLDLSWNSLFDRETVKSLFKGLLKNYELLSLDLSWNSLDKDCVPFLGPFLARTLSLRRFNLSGNRFSPHDAEAIARSLSRNVSLEEFFLGNNPLKAQGALALVRVLAPNRSPSSSLRHLDLENIWADKNVLPELEKIREERPWLRIRLGGVLGDFQIIGPDPRKLLMDRAIFEAMKPKKRKLKKNFGHFVLTLGDTFASKAQFMEAIKKFKLKLSESLVEEIMKAFSGPKQVVDQGAIKSYFLEQYPDTRPPSPPTEKKAKKAKKAEKKN
ncbi:leucine-rich repeat-containing protein 74A-like [Orussus abietinus]|uniref:leucine-rich repeat-containing protein 74A-like n=1 Tax=Orussus abietinus TaxID=222816 RepID=UPI000C716179|nr:leucine-rich repeat-containing protein 74A-like [Orussus abietinus]